MKILHKKNYNITNLRETEKLNTGKISLIQLHCIYLFKNIYEY